MELNLLKKLENLNPIQLKKIKDFAMEEMLTKTVPTHMTHEEFLSTCWINAIIRVLEMDTK